MVYGRASERKVVPPLSVNPTLYLPLSTAIECFFFSFLDGSDWRGLIHDWLPCKQKCHTRFAKPRVWILESEWLERLEHYQQSVSLYQPNLAVSLFSFPTLVNILASSFLSGACKQRGVLEPRVLLVCATRRPVPPSMVVTPQLFSSLHLSFFFPLTHHLPFSRNTAWSRSRR